MPKSDRLPVLAAGVGAILRAIHGPAGIAEMAEQVAPDPFREPVGGHVDGQRVDATADRGERRLIGTPL